ncbi:MAG: TrbC/VirB2 family protein [bacterium]
MQKSKFILKVLFLVSIFLCFPFVVNAEEGKAITIGSVDELLWSIVKTIQYYSLPMMAIALVGLGAKLITSGDDNQTKQSVKSWMIKVLSGGLVIFGASSIANVLKLAVGG